MSFVTAIKDYIDLLNNVYDSVSGNVSFQLLISQTFIYIFGSIKYILYYFLSFQWFRDLCYLPIIVPQISTSILKETFFLETPLTTFFTFLETPTYINNKFLIGFLNSFFLCLPISAAHLIWARRLLIQGIPAGIAAGLGNIVGQTWFLFCILLGLRLFIIPWFSLEPISYIIGLVFILTVVYDMVHERALQLIQFSDKTKLIKIFFINFVLSWTEQTFIYQYFGNLTFSSEPTILEIFSANSEFEFFLIHGSYLFGIVIGNLVFTTLFGWFFLNISNFLLQLSSFPYSKWINQLNVILLTTIIGFTLTSIPFYSLDYLLGGSFGFVSQDKAFEKTFFAPTTLGDTNKMLGGGSGFQSLETDIAPFDRGRYLRFDSNDSFEELNYQGEYAWTARQDRRAIYQNDRFRKLILDFFQKTNQDSSKLDADSSNKSRIDFATEKSKKNPQNQEQNLPLTNGLQSKPLDLQSKPLDFSDSEDIDEFNSSDRPSVSFFNLNERLNKDSQIAEVLEPFFNASFSDQFIDDSSKTVNPVFEQKMKQKYYSNPVYKLLLSADIDSFISRQPNSHSLTPKEEQDLFEKRLILANYYDSLRYYNKLPYAEDFQNFFSGSKSYADRVYNHQFKGTLKIVRRLFSITLNQEQNPQQNRILKFDQPLYKTKISQQNKLYHEELEVKKTKKSPFIQLVNPIPFYTGWDEQLRKLVITNRLLPRNLAGFAIKGQDQPKSSSVFLSKLNEDPNLNKDKTAQTPSNNNQNSRAVDARVTLEFTSWPIPKFILEKPKNEVNIPYNVLFESINDPKNDQITENIQELKNMEWIMDTVPPNMKKINPDQITEVAPPSRGGFIWPGHSYLKFNLTSLFKK